MEPLLESPGDATQACISFRCRVDLTDPEGRRRLSGADAVVEVGNERISIRTDADSVDVPLSEVNRIRFSNNYGRHVGRTYRVALWWGAIGRVDLRCTRHRTSRTDLYSYSEAALHIVRSIRHLNRSCAIETGDNPFAAFGMVGAVLVACVALPFFADDDLLDWYFVGGWMLTSAWFLILLLSLMYSNGPHLPRPVRNEIQLLRYLPD